MANVFELDWTDRHDPGLAGKTTRLGAPAGAERLGATVYEIAPGAAGSPLHAHHANEELIIVLAGSPTLRTADSHRRFEVGEVVACPIGPRGAHQLRNGSDDPARVLVVSTMIYPDVVEMLDSDKILASRPRRGVSDRIALALPRSAHIDRLVGEPVVDD